jgi:hypothetical protein
MPLGPQAVLFALLDTQSLLSLMQCCSALSALVQCTCFNLVTLLRPFLPGVDDEQSAENIRRFRKLQAQIGIIISGSTALQFLARTRWVHSDLDLFVHRRHAFHLMEFLCGLGYHYQPREGQSANMVARLEVILSCEHDASEWEQYMHLDSGISGVFDFFLGNRKIQVICATRLPMEVVLSFHSSECRVFARPRCDRWTAFLQRW